VEQLYQSVEVYPHPPCIISPFHNMIINAQQLAKRVKIFHHFCPVGYSTFRRASFFCIITVYETNVHFFYRQDPNNEPLNDGQILKMGIFGESLFRVLPIFSIRLRLMHSENI
jgi:hypothetical protein